jgi:hypothetical protein
MVFDHLSPLELDNFSHVKPPTTQLSVASVLAFIRFAPPMKWARIKKTVPLQEQESCGGADTITAADCDTFLTYVPTSVS